MTNTSPFPTLFVDLDIVRSNISKMNDKVKRNNAEFRPHFKTHQSRQIGRMFRKFGVEGITVSSLKMANYFAEDGWKDITIAFPANILAADYYNSLAAVCQLKTLVISEKVVSQLDAQLQNELGLYIEIDPNYGRSGIPVSDHERIASVIKAIERSENCNLAGFYCHAGHTYRARSKKEVEEIAGKALGQLALLKKVFPEISLCFGDTPSCSVLEDFGPADQISPGNFVFYDWMQVEIGACTPAEIAVTMKCPIIEKFDDREEILIHGGAVHFSKDSAQNKFHTSFGQLITPELSEENYLQNLSQEHGIIHCSPGTYNSFKIGDSVDIYPIHSCLTADVMRGYYSIDGKILDHMNKSVEAF
ncbi:MAG: alanine racemase [Balneolaceae bacterium]